MFSKTKFLTNSSRKSVFKRTWSLTISDIRRKTILWDTKRGINLTFIFANALSQISTSPFYFLFFYFLFHLFILLEKRKAVLLMPDWLWKRVSKKNENENERLKEQQRFNRAVQYLLSATVNCSLYYLPLLTMPNTKGSILKRLSTCKCVI